jgi:hypothetical protein
MNENRSVQSEVTENFLCEASNILEVLCNLNFLICEEADCSAKIRQYVDLTDERLKAMAHLINESRERPGSNAP